MSEPFGEQEEQFKFSLLLVLANRMLTFSVALMFLLVWLLLCHLHMRAFHIFKQRCAFCFPLLAWTPPAHVFQHISKLLRRLCIIQVDKWCRACVRDLHAGSKLYVILCLSFP